MPGKLFVRRRDGRVEVRLNDYARSVARDAFVNVLSAERDPEHVWHAALSGPIDPSLDTDNPVSMLSRQNETSTNAELACVTIDESFLSENEAWAWLTTLQVALRSMSVSRGVLDDEQLANCPEDLMAWIQAVQHLLFELAACF